MKVDGAAHWLSTNGRQYAATWLVGDKRHQSVYTTNGRSQLADWVKFHWTHADTGRDNKQQVSHLSQYYIIVEKHL